MNPMPVLKDALLLLQTRLTFQSSLKPLPPHYALFVKADMTYVPLKQGRPESIDEVAQLVQTLLLEKALMLRACFGLSINDKAQICSCPQLIEGFVPDLDYLPQLVLSLARDVDWDTEQECFEGVAKA